MTGSPVSTYYVVNVMIFDVRFHYHCHYVWASQQTQARGTRMGCRRAARVTPRRAVAGFDAGIHTGPASFLPVNSLCRVFH